MGSRNGALLAASVIACVLLTIWLTGGLDTGSGARPESGEREDADTLLLGGRQQPLGHGGPALETAPPPNPDANEAASADGNTPVCTFQVVVTSNGRPLGNAQVYYSGPRALVVVATTNASGRAAVQIPGTTRHVLVRAPGHLPASQRVFWPRKTYRFDLLPAKHHVRVRLQHQGTPAANVPVVLAAERVPFQEQRTNAAGEARFPLPDFGTFIVRVSTPAYRPVERLDIPIDTAAAEQHVDVALESQGAVYGVVQRTNGDPIEGAHIVVDDKRVAQTDANGEFSAPSGTQLRVELQGYRTRSYGVEGMRDRMRVRLSRVGTLADLQRAGIHIEKTEPKLDCQVVDADGRPVAGLTVHVWSRVRRTDAQGRFASSARGRYHVNIRKSPWWLRLTGSGAPAPIIRLPPDGKVTGRVHLPEDVGDVGVMIYPSAGTGPEIEQGNTAEGGRVDATHHPVEVGRDGRFAFEALAVGRYTLSVVPDPLSSLRPEVISLRVLRRNAPLEVRLQHLERTRIRVIGPDGKPVARARVSQHNRTVHVFSESPARYTDEAGWAAFPGQSDVCTYFVDCIHGSERLAAGAGDHVVRFDPPHRMRVTLTGVSIPDGTRCGVGIRSMVNGAKIPGARLTLAGSELVLDVAKLDPTLRYEVSVGATGYWSPWAELAFGENEREATVTVEMFREDEHD